MYASHPPVAQRHGNTRYRRTRYGFDRVGLAPTGSHQRVSLPHQQLLPLHAFPSAINWFFSVDNINAASDRVLRLTDRLELPKLLRRTPDRSHRSTDGQKFEVRVDSFNANHSFKYFGKEQGVSVYTFRDERDPLWHSLVFSAADRESAYVIDGLMHNEVVKSNIHSTDAFGYSEAIFGTSHLLGVSYAPRFKNLKRQRLYIFRSRHRGDQYAAMVAAVRVLRPHVLQHNELRRRVFVLFRDLLGRSSDLP